MATKPRGRCARGLDDALRAARSDGSVLATDQAAVAAARSLAVVLDDAIADPNHGERSLTGISYLSRELRLVLASLGLTVVSRRELGGQVNHELGELLEQLGAG